MFMSQCVCIPGILSVSVNFCGVLLLLSNNQDGILMINVNDPEDSSFSFFFNVSKLFAKLRCLFNMFLF